MSIESRIEYVKPLKDFSTFGIGGAAQQFIAVSTIEEMQEVRRYALDQKLPFWVIGKGSNSLFDDRGFDGLVIFNKIDFIEFNRGNLHVGAGTSFSLLGSKMARKGWSGLEFACGVPGSVGGAIYMNAGANQMETADSLVAVGYVDGRGNFIEKVKSELSFSYRASSFHKTDHIIVSGKFALQEDPGVRDKQRAIIEQRMTTQPYDKKSAGCVFRNPAGEKAGALIEACGLKGQRVGGAEVSLLHANFIVNRGGATAQDVLDLAALIQDKVQQTLGLELQMEIYKVPYAVGEDVSG